MGTMFSGRAGSLSRINQKRNWRAKMAEDKDHE